jgi:hypothetical protein
MMNDEGIKKNDASRIPKDEKDTSYKIKGYAQKIVTIPSFHIYAMALLFDIRDSDSDLFRHSCFGVRSVACLSNICS